MPARGVLDIQVEACLRNLKLLAAEHDDSSTCLLGTERVACLAEFLTMCAQSLAAELGLERPRFSDELRRAREVFVQAGLEALAARSWQASDDWLQIGIRPRDDQGSRGELCRRVAGLARRLINDSAIDNFFYMNKPPGMRLRFQPATESSADLAGTLHVEMTRWRTEGLVDSIEPGVYEPECQLFGGPRSMPFVHALFTVDSLIWLDYHACRAIEGDAVDPAWLVSLAVLRTVFAGLDITGWEDLGVWDRVRDMTGRRLGEAKVSLPMYAVVAGRIRDVWYRRDRLMNELHPAVKKTAALLEPALLTGAAQWRSGYFRQPGPSLGPRAAAAFYVIFHWNRAALSREEQALLAESLSERIFTDGRE